MAFWDTKRNTEMDYFSHYRRILTSKVTFSSINKLMANWKYILFFRFCAFQSVKISDDHILSQHIFTESAAYE